MKLWYTVKAIEHEYFSMWTAHVVDDECNEYTAIIKGEYVKTRHYYDEDSLTIIDLQPYDRGAWREWLTYADVARVRVHC